jgi:hypothetical protein
MWVQAARLQVLSAAGLGFHLTTSAVSSAARRLVTLRLGERLAHRLGADNIANLSQCLNAGIMAQAPIYQLPHSCLNATLIGRSVRYGSAILNLP